MTEHRPLTIIDLMEHPGLFADEFSGPSWEPWKTFLRIIFALPLEPHDLDFYEKCTGRRDVQTVPYQEVWAVCGRRGGKSKILALIAVWLTCFDDKKFLPYLSAGELGVVMIVAVNMKQAKVIFRYAKAFLNIPLKIGRKPQTLMETRVVRDGAEEIEFANHLSIEIRAGNFRTLRSATVICALMDEVAYYLTDELGASPDTEVIGAIEPAMATIPDRLLLCASNPFTRKGALWEAYKDNFGRVGAEELVWNASSKTMNPTLTDKFLAKKKRKDKVKYACEYLAQFRDFVDGYISRDDVEACISDGVAARPYNPDFQYFGFVDPSGGRHDSFAYAIAHFDKVPVLDFVYEKRAPFRPKHEAAECCRVMQNWGITSLTGDNYGAEISQENFKDTGTTYLISAMSKSELFLNFMHILNDGSCLLLDNDEIGYQFCNLVRKTTFRGGETIGKGPGSRDDLVNAISGAMLLARSAPVTFTGPFSVVCGPYVDHIDRQDAGYRNPELGRADRL